MDHGQSLLIIFMGVLDLALPETWAGPGSHSLRYFHTAWTRPELGEPRFLAVGYVDDEELVRFDTDAPSPRIEPRAAWMEGVVQVNPNYWERETRVQRKNARTFRISLETLRGYYNQSKGGVHTLQTMLGCEVSPDGRFQRGFSQFAYDGTDYVALDTKTWTWTEVAPQAEISKRKWEEKSLTERVKVYLEDECVLWLFKYLEMGKEALTRTVPPSVRVSCHTGPSGEVTLRCWAQGFYPPEISLSWLRDREEQLQDSEFIETRPGGDGTFQKWAAVGVTQGQERRYTCRVQHKGLALPLTLKWEPPPSSTRPTLGVIAGVLIFLLTAVLAGVVMSKRKNSGGNGEAAESDHGSDVSVTI